MNLRKPYAEDDIDKARLIKTQIEDAKTRLDKAYKKNIRNRNRKKPVLGENEIARVVSGWTKIPVTRLTENEAEKLSKLENTLHKRVIGQEEAVSAVAKAVKEDV